MSNRISGVNKKVKLYKNKKVIELSRKSMAYKNYDVLFQEFNICSFSEAQQKRQSNITENKISFFNIIRICM